MDMAECVEHRAVDENVSSDVEWDEEMRCFVLVCLDCGLEPGLRVFAGVA
jgi:hypothetical protein